MGVSFSVVILFLNARFQSVRFSNQHARLEAILWMTIADRTTTMLFFPTALKNVISRENSA